MIYPFCSTHLYKFHEKPSNNFDIFQSRSKQWNGQWRDEHDHPYSHVVATLLLLQ